MKPSRVVFLSIASLCCWSAAVLTRADDVPAESPSSHAAITSAAEYDGANTLDSGTAGAESTPGEFREPRAPAENNPKDERFAPPQEGIGHLLFRMKSDRGTIASTTNARVPGHTTFDRNVGRLLPAHQWFLDPSTFQGWFRSPLLVRCRTNFGGYRTIAWYSDWPRAVNSSGGGSYCYQIKALFSGGSNPVGADLDENYLGDSLDGSVYPKTAGLPGMIQLYQCKTVIPGTLIVSYFDTTDANECGSGQRFVLGFIYP